jgi:hypothetical protein
VDDVTTWPKIEVELADLAPTDSLRTATSSTGVERHRSNALSRSLLSGTYFAFELNETLLRCLMESTAKFNTMTSHHTTLHVKSQELLLDGATSVIFSGGEFVASFSPSTSQVSLKSRASRIYMGAKSLHPSALLGIICH